MQNTSLYAPIYDQSVMMHECVYHDNDGVEQTKRYTFKSAVKVEVGDKVLCQTRGWYHICTVVAVNVSIPIDSNTCYRWIIGNVTDMLVEAYALTGWEEQLIDEINRKRAEAMRMQMIEHIGVSPNGLTMLMSHDDTEQDNDK